MHTLKIRIKDNVYEKIQYFLNNLPKEDIEILSDDIEAVSCADSINFSVYKISSYKKIKDPVKWQKAIREEWDR